MRSPIMPKVFVSYRRSDSPEVTGRIYDRLVEQFGPDRVFRDLDSIPAGVDFRAEIARGVEECGAVLVVIGPGWLVAADANGNRRLDDPNDFVRPEVEAALLR